MIAENILKLPRSSKRAIVLAVDLVLLPLALWGSFSLRLGELYRPTDGVIWLFIAAPVIAIPIFVRMGLYRAIIRYLGAVAMWTVVKAVTMYTLAWGVLVLLSAVPGVPRSVLLINWLMAIVLIGGTRALARWWLLSSHQTRPYAGRKKRVAVIE
jgi:FlaA1/EpsC-like NDP-sugar epimerase